jgi:uncharacterized membrane protein
LESAIITQLSNGRVVIHTDDSFTSIAVYTILGEKVFEENMESGKNQSLKDISLKSGMYFIVIQAENKTISTPIIVQ